MNRVCCYLGYHQVNFLMTNSTSSGGRKVSRKQRLRGDRCESLRETKMVGLIPGG